MTKGYSREQAKKLVATSGGRGGKLTDDNGNRVTLEYEYRGRYDGKPAKITNFPHRCPIPGSSLQPVGTRSASI